MCTCCTSPLVVGLRQRGTGTAASVAYWLGNPLLNPAVLVFLFLVAPWQFGVVRIIVGVSVVVGGSALMARLFAANSSAARSTIRSRLARPRLVLGSPGMRPC
jgi:uncharacterized protein